jgi:hypothetical protein
LCSITQPQLENGLPYKSIAILRQNVIRITMPIYILFGVLHKSKSNGIPSHC